MEIHVPLPQGLALKMGVMSSGAPAYPTARMQRGLLLFDGEKELAEEAVGFGVPVVKRGMTTIFPGEAQIDIMRGGPAWIIRAVYRLNLVERLSTRRRGTVRGGLLYLAKGSMSELIRRFPPLRGLLTSASSALRRLFGWQTTYERAPATFEVGMLYGIDQAAGALTIEADFAGLQGQPITEAIVMHEQGAHHFDEYRDSDGTRLLGGQVGCWDGVAAAEATFLASRQRVAFSVNRVAGARLFRGRELVGSRLAWSGFGYTMSPSIGTFKGTLKIERLP